MKVSSLSQLKSETNQSIWIMSICSLNFISYHHFRVWRYLEVSQNKKKLFVLIWLSFVVSLLTTNLEVEEPNSLDFEAPKEDDLMFGLPKIYDKIDNTYTIWYDKLMIQ